MVTVRGASICNGNSHANGATDGGPDLPKVLRMNWLLMMDFAARTNCWKFME